MPDGDMLEYVLCSLLITRVARKRNRRELVLIMAVDVTSNDSSVTRLGEIAMVSS